MAEIFILIIFLLLLAFATMLDREKKQYDTLTRLVANENEYLDRIVSAISTEEPTLTEDIVRAIEKTPKVVSLIQKNELSEAEESVDETIVRAVEKLNIEKQLNSADDKKTPMAQRLQDALHKQSELQAEVENLTNQKSNIMAQLKKEGRGVDWPPCWADKNGKPEYIFQTALTNHGIFVTDISPAHRKEAKAKLPIGDIILGQSLSVGAFTEQTNALFQWSRKNECHHFAVIEDQTGANEKAIYKQQRAAVESHFYIFQKSGTSSKVAPPTKVETTPEVDPHYVDHNLDPEPVKPEPVKAEPKKNELESLIESLF